MKTLYNYIDLGLLNIINAGRPIKLRRNTKLAKVKHHKKKLGKSIDERSDDTDSCEEFGHWEIDNVIGPKSNNDCVLLTILERKTRNDIIEKSEYKIAEAVTKALHRICNTYGEQFSKVFKSITGDNGSEFVDLSSLEVEANKNVYFTHPYSSFEKGTNERHNGLIRRFILKGKRISDYSSNDIEFIENWMNTLPRKILNYKTPKELFEIHLDEIYAV